MALLYGHLLRIDPEGRLDRSVSYDEGTRNNSELDRQKISMGRRLKEWLETESMDGEKPLEFEPVNQLVEAVIDYGEWQVTVRSGLEARLLWDGGWSLCNLSCALRKPSWLMGKLAIDLWLWDTCFRQVNPEVHTQPEGVTGLWIQRSSARAVHATPRSGYSTIVDFGRRMATAAGSDAYHAAPTPGMHCLQCDVKGCAVRYDTGLAKQEW